MQQLPLQNFSPYIFLSNSSFDTYTILKFYKSLLSTIFSVSVEMGADTQAVEVTVLIISLNDD